MVSNLHGGPRTRTRVSLLLHHRVGAGDSIVDPPAVFSDTRCGRGSAGRPNVGLPELRVTIFVTLRDFPRTVCRVLMRHCWRIRNPPRCWHAVRIPASAMSEARRPRVLVIDDDPSVREVLGSLLASFGYDCQTAVNGRAGLARFDEGGWDLVLTD